MHLRPLLVFMLGIGPLIGCPADEPEPAEDEPMPKTA